MLNKNEIYEAVITDYTAEGQGVAHVEGCAVFIPNAVAGEKCRVRIEVAKKNWAAGKIVEILEKSPHRINRECPVAKLCGGCDFVTLNVWCGNESAMAFYEKLGLTPRSITMEVSLEDTKC